MCVYIYIYIYVYFFDIELGIPARGVCFRPGFHSSSMIPTE